MQFYSKRTVDEQASRLPYELREAYRNSQIDRITIFDGKVELEITGYAEYSYLDEKSYKTQPIRTQDGVVAEIEEYATFLTPRLIVKYNMMGIDDYRAFMKMIKGRNGFIIKCYDVVEDKIVRNQMYVATPSMPIIYQQFLIALGIQEYAIELIGTNALINASEDGDIATEEITFYDDIYDTLYSANLGQTWRDWISSKKNSANGKIVTNYYGEETVLLYSKYRVYFENKAIHPDDYIFMNRTYSLV